MKKKSLVLLISIANVVYGQQNLIDSLKDIISSKKGDTIEVNALASLAHQQVQFDSGIKYNQQGLRIKYAHQGLLLAKKINYGKGKADCLMVLSGIYADQHDYGHCIQYALDALTSYKAIGDNEGVATAHLMLQSIYKITGDNKKSLAHAFLGKQLSEANDLKARMFFPGHHLAPFFLAEIGETYSLTNQLDSALFYTQESIEQKELFNGAEWDFPVYLLATIQTMQGNYKSALKNFHSVIPLALQNGFPGDTLHAFIGMSTLFKKTGQFDSAIYYARIVAESDDPAYNLEGLKNLAEVYKSSGNKDSAIKYIVLSHTLKDSIFSKEKDREIQNITFNERLKQEEIISEQAKYKSKIQLYTLAAGLSVLLLLAVILWRNNLHKQKAKIKIELAELQHKTVELEMQALRAQMNPHFIFNCLTAINRFILTNESETAANYLTKFSRLIRMVLNNSREAFIPLEDELTTLQLYMDLEKLRFKNSFDYIIKHIDNVNPASIAIPPLLLQPFVENAIWHGLMHKESGGKLEIILGFKNDFLCCTITDNGVGREKALTIKSKSAEKNKSMGLQITKSRMALLNSTENAHDFTIDDLIDENGNAKGTSVFIKIKCKEMQDEFE